MKIEILSLFPEMIQGALQHSIMARAVEQSFVSVDVTDFRQFATDRHRSVDDYPYGGGAGMVLKPEPLFLAVESIWSDRQPGDRVVLLSPQGVPFTQSLAQELAKSQRLMLICGHYEGFDERVCEYLATDEISIGDYVLTGGELAALVITDAVVRLLPGVLGNKESAAGDSFSEGLLEFPQYTRPEDFRGMRVPAILLSGHHGRIARWRRAQSIRRTLHRRPDLLEHACLAKSDKLLLNEFPDDD